MKSKKTIAATTAAALTLAAEIAYSQSVQQTSEMIDFNTGAAERGGGVLTRSADAVYVRLSTMDLDKKAAYSAWWVVFNEPWNCLTPWQCGEPDIVAGGVLNEVQIQAAKISVFYADGFVTGTDGTANIATHLESGPLPENTFVNFGWGPGLGPPNGLIAGNGLIAEMHLVIRTHGKAVAGSVGLQTSTFTGLCDVQTCADQQAIVFQSTEAP